MALLKRTVPLSWFRLTVLVEVTACLLPELLMASTLGPQSPYNEAGCIPVNEPQTNQYAELKAALAALEALSDKNMLQRFGTRLVVVMTDSSYLATGISEWIWNWRLNGFRNSSGTPVVNASMFLQLHDMIDAYLDDGVEVKFWRVPREWNGDADHLANWALNSQGSHTY